MVGLPDLSAYAGRWVALADGAVAGVGQTPMEALRWGRHNRPKETLVLWFVEPPGGEVLVLSPLLEQLRPFLVRQEMPVYLVGGAVRDALLGQASHDLDFVVPEKAISLAFRVADELGVPAYVLDRERDTGRVVLPELATTLDFASFRGADLLADLRDRDFTVNAIALPVSAQTTAGLIDPCGGQADLAAGVLRMTHARVIEDDPLRALRALRLAVTFGLRLAAETESAVSAAADLLDQVSTERVRDELLRLLATAVPHEAIRQLDKYQLLRTVLPEIADLAVIEQSPPHHEPVLPHTLSVLAWLVQLETAVLDGEPPQTGPIQEAREALADWAAPLQAYIGREVAGGVNGRLLLRLGALFHDVGKRDTIKVEENGRIHFYGHETVGAKLTARRLRQLTFSNQAITHVQTIVAGHMRPLHLVNTGQYNPSRRTIYRFFQATGEAGLDICLLTLADHLATFAGAGQNWSALLTLVRHLLQAWFEQAEEVVTPPPLLNGHELMSALNLPPGPEIGRLLRLIAEGQAAGEIRTREEALKFARQVAGTG